MSHANVLVGSAVALFGVGAAYAIFKRREDVYPTENDENHSSPRSESKHLLSNDESLIDMFLIPPKDWEGVLNVLERLTKCEDSECREFQVQALRFSTSHVNNLRSKLSLLAIQSLSNRLAHNKSHMLTRDELYEIIRLLLIKSCATDKKFLADAAHEGLQNLTTQEHVFELFIEAALE